MSLRKRTILQPCPFCGHDLDASWDRPNPKARCLTEGCKGRQLPVLNLDQPADIAAWNRRDGAATQAQLMSVMPDGWRKRFADAVYDNLAAADNQDIPLEEYPARILCVLDSIVVLPSTRDLNEDLT